MDVSNGPSLRLRGGVNSNSDNKKHDLNMCTSVMSPETKRLLPPTSETIMTKPFPIRGNSVVILFLNSAPVRSGYVKPVLIALLLFLFDL